MTEEAKKVLEEVYKKQIEDIRERAKQKTIDSATDELLECIAVLGCVIEAKVEETNDPVVMMGGAALMDQLTKTTNAVTTYKDLCEVSELIEERKKNLQAMVKEEGK